MCSCSCVADADRQQSPWNEPAAEPAPRAWTSEKAVTENGLMKSYLWSGLSGSHREMLSFGALLKWIPGEGISLFKQSFIMPICYFTVKPPECDRNLMGVSHDAEGRVRFISISAPCYRNTTKINFPSQQNSVLCSVWWWGPAHRSIVHGALLAFPGPALPISIVSVFKIYLCKILWHLRGLLC